MDRILCHLDQLDDKPVNYWSKKKKKLLKTLEMSAQQQELTTYQDTKDSKIFTEVAVVEVLSLENETVIFSTAYSNIIVWNIPRNMVTNIPTQNLVSCPMMPTRSQNTVVSNLNHSGNVFLLCLYDSNWVRPKYNEHFEEMKSILHIYINEIKDASFIQDLVALWDKSKFQIIWAGNSIFKFWCDHVKERSKKLLI